MLQAGGKMGLLISKIDGGYQKRKEFSTRYKTILSFACDKKTLSMLPTKISPATTGRVSISFPAPAQNARFITIDDIESFNAIVNQIPTRGTPLSENKIKNGFACIIGEKWIPKDWGGEKSDLFSTQIRVSGKRLPLAIAFKGSGTSGKLVPAKMGKNGDQINRLFDELAQVFLVIYHGEIDSSIIAQMHAQAIVESLKGRKVFYGVINGQDLSRLRAAYPNCF